MLLNTVIISLESSTYAIKAKRLLSKLGISVRAVKIDALGAERGCTHGIEFDNSLFYSVISALKESGLKYSVLDGKSK